MDQNDVPNEVIQSDISEVSMAAMKPMMTQREFMYIDLDLLYDFRLTALMAFIKGKEDYEYIYKHLDEYLAAPTLEVCKFFPDLGVTEADLDRFLADPKYRTFVAAAALPTGFMKELQDIIKFINTENESKETHRSLKITLNCRRKDTHPYLINKVVRAIHSSDPGVKVEVTEYPDWTEVPASLIKMQDMICVYDVRNFVANGTTSQKLLTELNELSNCSIVGLKVSDLGEEDTAVGIINLQDVLSIMCKKFTLVDKSLLKPEDLANG